MIIWKWELIKYGLLVILIFVGHNKEFLFGKRGFSNPEDMNREIVRRWNAVVSPEDEVYHLGDLVLSDIDAGIEFVKQLNGKIHLIRGNHDTDTKVERFKNECPNIVSIEWATMIRHKKIMFFLSHCPSITKTPEDGANKQGIINLFGHTHQTHNFYNGNFYMYHVGCDSHNLTPVSIEQIIEDIKNEREKYAKKD